MEGLLTGILGLLTFVLFGILAGAGVGAVWDLAGALAIVGALSGAVGFVVRDRLRAGRLLDWFRGPLDVAAPRQAGFWGELAYRAERALARREEATQRERERREQFLSAIEASPNGVLLLGAQDQIEWCNRVAADHFGLDPQRDVRQPVTNLVRTPAFVAYLQAGQYAQPVTYPNPRAQGTLSVLVKPYGPGLKLILSQDITERERAEAMRRDFVANVSHELRTPVGVILANAETLLDGALDDPKFSRTFVDALHRNAIRLTRLLDDLLDISRLEAGQAHLAPERFDLTEVAAQVIDALSVKAGEKAIDLQWSGDSPVWVRADANAVEQVLVNLIDNAIKYTPSGSRVLVGTAAQEDAGRVRVVVEDNGPGIDAQHRERIFERFYRVDPGRSREMGGTGLGLSIVRHLVESMGGSVGVEPATPKGARFWFTLPAQTEASLAAEATS